MGLCSKTGQFLIALLLTCGCANAAISRTQNVSANASSVAISSTTAGDVIVVFGYNGTSATAVSLPAGYTNLASATGTLQAGRCAYKISPGAETVTGTFTNATQVIAFVYRGTDPYLPCKTPNNLNNGNVATITYSGFLSMTNGANWVAGFGGAKAATAGMNGNTAVLTNRTSLTTANGLDSGTKLATFADQSLVYTTAGRWHSIAIEVQFPYSSNGFF